MTDFVEAVEQVVAGLKPGSLATYGEIAAEAGRPGAARAVGNVLQRTTRTLPWWRVVTVNGRLVPGLEDRHAELLAAEGILTVDGRVAIARRARSGI